jgi:CBS domain-containing protein
MQPLPSMNGTPRPLTPAAPAGQGLSDERWEELAGTVTEVRTPQELFDDETLGQALRQLTMYGRSGLPVLSRDREHIRGWITRYGVLAALADSVEAADRRIEQAAVAADFAAADPEHQAHTPSTPLDGFAIVELSIGRNSPAAGRDIGDVSWPKGSVVVSLTQNGRPVPPRLDARIHAGERVVVLAPQRRGETPGVPTA